MKNCRALPISLVFNSLLLAALALISLQRVRTPGTEKLLPEDPGVLPEAGTAPPKPFNWSQVESADYRTYISNLRSIGCPEQTIRDIVSADVDSNVFAARREVIRKRHQSLVAKVTGRQPVGDVSLETEQRNLWQEESTLVDNLLGFRPQAQPLAASDTAPSSGDSRSVEEEPRRPGMPLAFLSTDATLLGLSELQLAAVERLRRHFLSDLGGGNLDAGSAEYAARWHAAQPRLDDLLRASLGQEVYRKFQLQSARQEVVSGTRH